MARKGFTLIEMVVAVAIFAILLSGLIGLFDIMSKSVKASRDQTVLASLASNYVEIVRNLPYSQVGTKNGNPNGSLPDQTSPTSTKVDGTTYQIYYEVTYIDDPADGTILLGTDSDPEDYKQVKVSIKNTTTDVVTDFVTNVTPLGLEGTSNAGALSIKVFDANGNPISGASIVITNTAGTITLDRSTDSTGNWVEVGLPAGVNAYHIVATKSGYSTDQTYPITAGNPNPTKPDSTVVNGQVTQVSFSIDLLSNLTIDTLDSTCHSLSGVGVNVTGSKLIGTNPNVYKYNSNLTSSGGAIALNNIEWDTYTPTLLTGQSLMVVGTSPIQQISVLPSSNQTFTMVLGPQTSNSLLVIVKDASTGNALEGTTVQLQSTSPVQNFSGVTGGSIWTQDDWSGGSGQADFSSANRYFSDDGNIDVTTVPTGVRLNKISGNYVSSGQLTSSSFDTGGASNFTTLTWQPTSQTSSTSLEFQLASNSDDATWNFVGPDGTAATYYTVSGTNIAAALGGNRYIRYKAFLASSDPTQTPVLTGVAINYVAGCFTPGQISFGSLPAGSNYSLSVSLSGYQTTTLNNLNISGNQSVQIQLSQ